MKNIIISIICVCFSSVQLFAQGEWIEYYPVKQSQSLLKSEVVKNTNKQLIALPFFDDFAYPTITPISSLWCDSYAIVNSSFPKNPITIGSLTLDALNNNGLLYSGASSNPFISDYITSQPINLKTFEQAYKSDVLFINNGTYVLLDDLYYIYVLEESNFLPVTKGLVYNAGDTIYQKVGANYIPIQDSIYYLDGTTYEYILGSITNEHTIEEYTLQDSLALSFYFQSGGYGDIPELEDSLIVEFYVPFNRQGIFINEITKDWIEIYNATDTIISLTNYFLINDTLQEIINQNSLQDYKISIASAPVISPYSHGVLYASELGVISFENTYVYLYSPDTIVVDSVINMSVIDESNSYARIPDGNPNWSFSTINSKLECNPDWKHIWNTNNNTGDYFEYVYLPISNPAYLQKGFRFRFKNYTSLSNDESHARNEDFWNVDMVWLDSKREYSVSNIADVAFVDKIGSVYNSFTALPISHFQNEDITDFKMTVESKFTNFDDVFRKVKFNFSVVKKHSDSSLLFPTYETDIPAYTLAEERDILSDWNVDFIDFMKSDIDVYDETTFEFQYYFTDNNNPMYSQYRWNDTNRVSLIMNNWYAYDDGLPEAGYGLREAPMGRVAYKFDILEPDTLKAIDMYFNPTLYETAPIFNLCVWDVNSDGLPGNLLYYMPSEKVEFSQGLYSFVTYKIQNEGILNGDNEGVYIPSSYFVGWEQPYDVLLNIGLDVSCELQNKLYYNLGFEWVNSSQKGALLMRPIFGKLTSKQAPINTIQNNEIFIYPTCASDKIYINHDNVPINRYSIFDVVGREISTGEIQSNEINVSNIPNGLYTIQISLNNGAKSYHRCVIKK